MVLTMPDQIGGCRSWRTFALKVKGLHEVTKLAAGSGPRHW